MRVPTNFVSFNPLDKYNDLPLYSEVQQQAGYEAVKHGYIRILNASVARQSTFFGPIFYADKKWFTKTINIKFYVKELQRSDDIIMQWKISFERL